ncbi:GNAT family N-acetyltransferase [Streptomyces sp. SR27]|uniref:GNAT family N-acetyltransferase n=1 Tax=Streptomyces sp. SR27 TaxID=3076630 RepID=UPI00295BF470|nr:GNAT family N-acetyltransferase [Streptomyces sp. SR27]MDV9187479.1 GNAT family N-acetyltransferase [Streptomyces sp. SR27]
MTPRLRRYTSAPADVARVVAPLIAVYAKVREPLLHLPNYAVATFAERLERHRREPGFGAVLAFDAEEEPVGYAYGNTVESDDRWWTRMGEVDAGFTSAPALALKEIGVTPAHRGSGLARRIHDQLLAGRGEAYVSLMVNAAAGDGKVQRVYESWGYQVISTSRPSSESPVLTAMIRPTATAEEPVR